MSVSESIDHIRSLSPKLNKATDTANAVMQAAEKFLDECSVGIPVDIMVQDTSPVAVTSGDEDIDRQIRPRFRWDATYLSYRRVGGKYRVAVVNQTESGEPDSYGEYSEDFRIESERVSPWASAPRDEKLLTFPKLGELLKELAHRATKSLEAVQASGGDAIAIMNALSAKRKITVDAESLYRATRTDKSPGFSSTSFLNRETGRVIEIFDDPKAMGIKVAANNSLRAEAMSDVYVKIPKFGGVYLEPVDRDPSIGVDPGCEAQLKAFFDNLGLEVTAK